MTKWIVFITLPVSAMNIDCPDRLVASHPIDITQLAQQRTPSPSSPIAYPPLNPDNITEAMYFVYFRGNGEKIRPAVYPHLKKQVSITLDSPSDTRKEELYRITHQIRELKERQRVLGDSVESSSSNSSNLTPAVHDIVSEAITKALEEKERDAQISKQNELSAEQKYKLADKKLTMALLSHVLTAGCTAVITAIITTTAALVVNFTT